MEYRGTVIRGNGTGSQLGFPTANIAFTDTKPSGIYAARVMVDTVTYQAAVYADQHRHLLEAHLLDFSGDLYGKEIVMTLEEKLRDAERFSDSTALADAITADVARVRARRNS